MLGRGLLEGCRLRVGDFGGAIDGGVSGVSRTSVGETSTLVQLLLERAAAGDACFLQFLE